jgi:hypothetical protein
MKDKIYEGLKEAGFRVVLRYQDQRSGGWRIKLEIAKEEGTHERGEGWANMEGERAQAVLAIIQKYHSDAKVVYYRGCVAWLVAITYFKERAKTPGTSGRMGQRSRHSPSCARSI